MAHYPGIDTLPDSADQAPAPSAAAPADRRRPGRLAAVNPALLPILRNGQSQPALAGDAGRTGPTNDLDPVLGLVVASSLGIGLWLVIVGWLFWAA